MHLGCSSENSLVGKFSCLKNKSKLCRLTEFKQISLIVIRSLTGKLFVRPCSYAPRPSQAARQPSRSVACKGAAAAPISCPIKVDTRRRTRQRRAAVTWQGGTYDAMSGHGGAGDAHRVVCPYTFLAEQECISGAAVAKAV